METIRELNANILRQDAKILCIKAKMTTGFTRSHLLARAKVKSLQAEQILNRCKTNK